MDTQTLLKLIPPTISLIITSLFGLLIGVLVERFKNRFRTITYDVRIQKVTPPLSNNLGGQLQITLNNRVISTLKVATVEIENINSIDLENVVVRFTLGPGAIFQGNEGYLAKNFSWLYWTPQYNEYFQNVLDHFNELPIDPSTDLRDIPAELQQRINYVNTNKDYLIPVINRNEKAIFNFLIEDPQDGTEVGIYPSIVHKSVNFIKKIDDNKQKQHDLWTAIAIGLIIVALMISFIIYFNQESTKLIIVSVLIGISYSLIGYFVLNSYKRIKSFFK